MKRAIGNLFVVVVLAAVAFAFSERSDPPMPATQTRIDHLQMLDLAVRDDGRLIAVGERGHIFVSDDHGGAWRAVASPAGATLVAVRFVDAQRVVAVGHDAVIVRSEDGGEHWVKVQSDPEAEEPLLGAWFDADGQGIAVGAYGRLERTADGGASWARHEVEANEDGLHLNAVVRLAGGDLLIAGEAGLLLRSRDDGDSWEALESPYAGSFFGALALADGGALVFGMRGHVFRSDDGGDSWQEVGPGVPSSLFGGRVLADGRVVLAGQAGVVLISEDGAHSFVRVDNDDRRTRAAVAQGEQPDALLLVGEEGVERLSLVPAAGGRS